MTPFKTSALALAAAGTLAAAIAPATAAVPFASHAVTTEIAQDGEWNHGHGHGHGHDRGWHEGYRDYGRGYRDDDRRDYYRGPAWRGRDGRYYCRKPDGTTGLLIGGAAGALIGRGIAGHGDRTLGAILGAAGGALLGREVDRSGSRCG